MVERTAAFEPYALRWSPREVVGWWAETCEHQPRLRFWKSSKMGSVGDTFVGYMARALQTQTWLRSELRPFRVPIEQGDWPYVLRVSSCHLPKPTMATHCLKYCSTATRAPSTAQAIVL